MPAKPIVAIAILAASSLLVPGPTLAAQTLAAQKHTAQKHTAGADKPAPAPRKTVELSITVTGLKNEHGVVAYCIAPRGAQFPDCKGAGAQSGSARIAGHAARFHFTGLPAGEYAVAVFHDKNANHKLDTMLGIPKEGYGFSGNPGFMMRAPRFDEAAIEISQDLETEIRLRHIL